MVLSGDQKLFRLLIAKLQKLRLGSTKPINMMLGPDFSWALWCKVCRSVRFYGVDSLSDLGISRNWHRLKGTAPNHPCVFCSIKESIKMYNLMYVALGLNFRSWYDDYESLSGGSLQRFASLTFCPWRITEEVWAVIWKYGLRRRNSYYQVFGQVVVGLPWKADLHLDTKFHSLWTGIQSDFPGDDTDCGQHE